MLDILFEPPAGKYLALLLLPVSGTSLGLSVLRFTAAARDQEDYRRAQFFVRGIRCLLIGLTAGVWAAGFFWGQKWLFIIGLVIICQELYEGAILSSALKDGAAIEKEKKNFP